MRVNPQLRHGTRIDPKSFLREVRKLVRPTDDLVSWVKPFDREVFLEPPKKWPGMTRQLVTTKPAGTWYACGTGWLEYLLGDDGNQAWIGNYLYRFKLDKSGFIKIGTTRQFDAFHEKYKAPNDAYDPEDDIFSVNWPKVAKEYTGIQICPYMWQRRHVDWYYGWDVASGCFWQKEVLLDVEEINIRKLFR